MPSGDRAVRAGRHYRSALCELLDAGPFMERLLNELLVLVPSAEASSIGLAEGGARVVFTHASSLLRRFVGVSVETHASLSGHAMATAEVQCCHDATNDPRVDRSLMARIGMRSQIVVPLRRDGGVFGVVHVLSSRSDAFSGSDVARCSAIAGVVPGIITACAELARLAELLGPGPAEPCASTDGPDDVLARFVTQVLRPNAVAQLEARQRILEVLETSAFRIAFQPIIDLASGTMVALEALARFAGGSPERYFAEASEAGLGAELELAAVEMALRVLDGLPEPLRLALNVGPESLASDGLVSLLGDRGQRVVLELTEHAPVQDYVALEAILSRLRARGAELAVDDTGAGFASLSHIVRLSPEFVKLDRGIVVGVATDRVRRSLVAALVGFAHDLGAKVVAEGIETCEEHEVLRGLGVDYGQGFLLGSPGPLADHLRRHRAPRDLPPLRASSLSSGPVA